MRDEQKQGGGTEAVLIARAPTENKSDDTKCKFYEQVPHVLRSTWKFC
jgi:hypothetical protein